MAIDRTEALKIAKELMVAAMMQKLITFENPAGTVSAESGIALGQMLDELVTRIEKIQSKSFNVP